MREALARADLVNYLGGEGLVSGAALMATMSRWPCRVFQIDEFGQHVKAMGSGSV